MRRHFAKVTNIDLSDLKEKLLKNNDLFSKYSYRKEKYAHTEMEDIWVRYNKSENIGPKFNDEHSSEWYPVVFDLPCIPFICADLMRSVIGERLGGVLITKLLPGGEVKPHIDTGWHAKYYRKYYVAISNPKGAIFKFPSGSIEAEDGDVYEFDNSVLHSVENNSTEIRLAMIICIRKFEDSIDDCGRKSKNING